MIFSENCPSTDSLESFLKGDLDDDLFAQIETHLLSCTRCDETIRELDRVSDSLISELETLDAVTVKMSTGIPQDVLERTVSFFSSNASSENSVVLFDRARQIARELDSGSMKLDRFEVRQELGHGSFGHVFLAYDPQLDRMVALKLQHAKDANLSDSDDRFLREARSIAQLEHPHIVSLYETGQLEDGTPFLVTEYVEGETLEDEIKDCELSFRETAELVSKIAHALQHAHDRKIIHRDVKPSNIIMDPQGEPHIMDFGLAKRELGEATMTDDGEVMGTPSYMSPEQARGESHHVDARTDIYSLGVILYELLTTERPFQGNRRMLLLQVLEDEPRQPRLLNEKIPRDLETICLKAMSKTPFRRYRSAADLGADLERYLQGRPIQARPVRTFEKLWKWCNVNPLASSVFLTASLGAMIGFFYLSYLNRYFVQQTALESVRMESEMFEEINAFYSDLVGSLDGDHITVTDRYKSEPNSLPLPVTFTIDAGERISKRESGMSVRLYSDYPFREDGGPKDDFEQRAWEILKENPDDPIHEFQETDQGQVLRYAKARIMSESCVKCHNQDVRSPKRDWEVGDVAGVLKIERKLDRSLAEVNDGLRGAFVLVAGISVLSLALAMSAIILGRKRKAKLRTT